MTANVGTVMRWSAIWGEPEGEWAGWRNEGGKY